MPCYKKNTAPYSYGKISGTSYATEADCLNACKEGACCNGTTCSVKPQCQCNAAAGEVFKGIGTMCTGSPCCRDASGASCFGLTPFPYPQSLYLKIANTGSVTLNRTFTLEFYPSASGSEGQYGIYSPNARTGSTACSFTGFAGGCSQIQQNPVFSVYGYFSLSQGQWFGQLLYSDYYPGRQCGCDSFPLNISFSNDLCWLCDPSIVSDRSWTVLSYLTTHGEIAQASGGGVATLSKNPLP